LGSGVKKNVNGGMVNDNGTYLLQLRVHHKYLHLAKDGMEYFSGHILILPKILHKDYESK